MAYARTVGYVDPNPVARQPSRGCTDTIGWVFVDELRYALHRAPVGFIEGLIDGVPVALSLRTSTGPAPRI
ncbi:MAG: hypothetical protein ACRDUX_26195 [Mycobacterium sp.]